VFRSWRSSSGLFGRGQMVLGLLMKMSSALLGFAGVRFSRTLSRKRPSPPKGGCSGPRAAAQRDGVGALG